MSDLDNIDRKILNLLRKDSRISNAELAEKVGLSPSSCWRRVRAFEDNGVIRNYSVVLDDEKLNLNFQAIVHVQLTRHDVDKLADFIRAVQSKEEVKDCRATTGQSDYHLFIQCRDLNSYNEFLEDFLFRLPAVANAQTNVVLRTLKSRD